MSVDLPALGSPTSPTSAMSLSSSLVGEALEIRSENSLSPNLCILLTLAAEMELMYSRRSSLPPPNKGNPSSNTQWCTLGTSIWPILPM